MIILLFGITNVGKTTTGKVLAQKLGYQFIDLDEEIKKKHRMSLEQFVRENPWPHGRSKLKGQLLKELVIACGDEAVIAVSLIWYSRFFLSLFKIKQVVPVELTDSEENIFERLVFSDENDQIIEDDGYKKAHKKHYLKEIHRELMDCKPVFKNIKTKFYMDKKSPEEVADALIPIVEEAYREKQHTEVKEPNAPVSSDQGPANPEPPAASSE